MSKVRKLIGLLKKMVRKAELPAPRDNEKNPYLTIDGELNPGLIYGSMNTVGYNCDGEGGVINLLKTQSALLPPMLSQAKLLSQARLHRLKLWPKPPPSQRPIVFVPMSLNGEDVNVDAEV